MMIDLSINIEKTKQILTKFIQNEVKDAGYTKVVVGLSGGIDSSLACLLSVEALGAENVLGIRMPYEDSSISSLEDAQKIIDITHIESLTIPITSMAKNIFCAFPDITQLRKANILARLRMIVLYDQSVDFDGLVVGTGNRTECLLGYTTLFGDSACAFNPLGDLYKTQIRQLAKSMGVPQSIIEKPPSADLWHGQTDEGELGFTYEEIDTFFYLLLDQGYTFQECINLGISETLIDGVMRLVNKNKFKNRFPHIAQINSYDKRY
jgi:NAD+ synthase